MLIRSVLRAQPPRYPVDPISAGKFEETPQGLRFAGSPEALETIRRIKERTGLDIEVLPTPESTPSWVGGFFNPIGEEGGSNDPVKRRVYLNPRDVQQFTFEHELGHALDPYLDKSFREESELFNIFHDRLKKGEYETPAEGLRDYMLGLPRRRLDAELTAQKYARDRMYEQGLKDARTERNLAAYPLAYINQGIRKYEMSTAAPGDNNIVPDSVKEIYQREVFDPMTDMYVGPTRGYLMPNANTRVEYGDELTRRLFDLYSSPGYGEEVSKERRRAGNYAQRRLQE